MASEAKILTSEPHLCAPLLLAFLVAPPQVLSLPSEFLLEDEKKNAFSCYNNYYSFKTSEEGFTQSSKIGTSNVTKFPSSGSEIDCTRRLLTFSYLLSDDLYTSVYEIHPTFEVLSHDHREKKTSSSWF